MVCRLKVLPEVPEIKTEKQRLISKNQTGGGKE